MIRWFIWLSALTALAAGALVAAMALGARFGAWDFSFGLAHLREFAPFLLAAAGLGAIGVPLAAWKARGLLALALIGAISAGFGAFTPIKMRALATSNPLLHDVTTDFETPPAIVAGASAPRKNPPDYLGEDPARPEEGTVAEAQRKAFPDIAPLLLEIDLDAAKDAAQAVLQSMRMEILAEGPEGDGGWRYEAVDTSFWYGFKDDFIVRITAQAEGGVRIDVRSKSRVGRSDLGANAQRVRTFLTLMKARA